MSDHRPGVEVDPLDEATSIGDASALGTPGIDGRLSRGRDVGRYIVLDELGSGGMGVVYKAWDPALDRPVALKVLGAGRFATRQQVARFFDEARAIARLDDPTLVTIFDVGAIADCPYFTMEYIDGRTLAEQIEQDGTIAPDRVARIGAAIARGLHHAHTQGVVHRDVKPANVVIDDEGAPRVIDFGIARLLESSGDRTRTGQVLGTPAYMAPEQAMGRVDVIGPRTDVYGIGAVLYNAATGARPHRVGPDTPLGWARDLPRDLHAVCHRALAGEIDERYATAEALAEDLERFLRGEPVEAALPGPARRAAWWLRRRQRTLLGVALVFIVAAGAVGGWNAWQEAQRARIEAAEQARRDAAATGVLDAALVEAEAARARGDADAAAALEREAALRMDVQETRALGRFHLERAARASARGQTEAALDAATTAYAVAEADDERLAAMLALGRLFTRTRQAPELAAVNATLARRFPDARSAWAELELHDLIFARRFAEASAHPAVDEDMQPLLRALSQGTPTVHRLDPAAKFRYDRHTLYVADVIGDAHPEGWFRNTLLDLTDPTLPVLPWTAPPLGLADGVYFAPVRGAPGIFTTFGQRPRESVYRHDDGRWVHLAELDTMYTGNLTGADLDGDGRAEIYAQAPGRVRALVPSTTSDEPFAVEEVVADPTAEAAHAYANALRSAELGEPVLLLGTTGWQAYDLRIYRGDGSGRLELAARRQLGRVLDAIPVPDRDGRRLLVVSIRSVARDHRLFHADSGPFPQGLHVLEWTDDGLVHRAQLPTVQEKANLVRLISGDIDGDGLDDLIAVQVQSVVDHQVSVYRRTPDGWSKPLILQGFFGFDAIDVDGDGDDELIAVEDGALRVWVLGSGTEPLPVHTPQPLEPITGTGRTSAMEDLVALGRLDGALEAWKREIALGRSPIYAASRAADIAERLERYAEAAAFHTRVAEDPERAVDALGAAARAWRLARRADDERAVLLTRAEHPMASLEARAESHARLAALAATVASRLEIDFTQPLDRRWRIAQPGRVRRDPRGALMVRADPIGEVARLSLHRVGAQVAFEMKLDTPRIEMAGHVEVALVGRKSDGTDVNLGWVNNSGWGGGSIFQQGMFSQLSPSPRFNVVDAQLESTTGISAQLRLEHDFETHRTLVIDRQTGRQSLVDHDVGDLHEIDLVIRAGTRSDITSVVDLRIESLVLEGLSLSDAMDDDPIAAAARALADGKPRDALDALDSAGSSAELTGWRATALYGLGDHQRADALVRARLQAAVEPGSPFDQFLRGRLRRTPLTFAPLIREAWGARADDLLWRTFGVGFRKHADDPDFVRAADAALMGADVDMDGHPDPMIRARLLLARARMYRNIGEVGAARADLRACEAIPPTLMGEGETMSVEQARVLADLYLERAALEAHTNPTDAIDAVRAALAVSPTPAVTADRLRADEAIRALRDRPVWREVESAASW